MLLLDAIAQKFARRRSPVTPSEIVSALQEEVLRQQQQESPEIPMKLV